MITWYNATVPATEDKKSYNFGFSVKDNIASNCPEYWLNGCNVHKGVFREYFIERNISVVKIATQYETEAEAEFAHKLKNS
jgi:hypothetical protein